MGSRDPDRDLVERAQLELPYGTSAYNQLVHRYSAHVFRRSYRILRSRADAEDAAQDVFLAVYRSLPRFRFERPFSHWLSTITLNACRMILRRRAQEQRRRAAAKREGDPAPTPPQSDPALRQVVHELLDSLDPGTRIPLLMRFVEGYAYAEIAKELELSESAVKMRVSRGAKRLRELYEKRTATTAAPSNGTEPSNG
jgi:RNA polymerase sigma-70 factor (ECF subfamily)